MIRNIIFDVGKVLVSYEPDAYMESLGISKENQKKNINDAMFENPLWDASDQGLGQQTPDEFLQKFIAGAPELAEEITKIHNTIGNTVELSLCPGMDSPTGCSYHKDDFFSVMSWKR